jgi:hypothetical protein
VTNLSCCQTVPLKRFVHKYRLGDFISTTFVGSILFCTVI